MPQQNASLPAGRTRVAWSRLTPVRDDTRRRVRTLATRLRRVIAA